MCLNFLEACLLVFGRARLNNQHICAPFIYTRLVLAVTSLENTKRLYNLILAGLCYVVFSYMAQLPSETLACALEIIIHRALMA